MLSNRAYSLLSVKKIDAAQRIIEGFASTPMPDRGGDVMEPKGAEFVLPMPLLWFHDVHDPIGEVFSADVRAEGIYIKARISRVTEPSRLKTLVDEAWSAFTAVPMLVRGLSIGWGPLESEPIKGTKFRRISRWIWGELSAVTVPMNVQCTISAVKAADVGASVASDRPAVRPPAGVTALTTTKKAPMTIAEHAAALQQKRDATAVRIHDMVQASANAGSSFTDEEQQTYNELKGELSATDNHLAVLREASTLNLEPVSYTHLRAHETPEHLVCRLL